LVFLAVRRGEHQLEDLLADLLHARRAVGDRPAIDVHVVGHALIRAACLVASFKDGVGLQPNTEPRPVVKQMTLQPPATCPVAETGS